MEHTKVQVVISATFFLFLSFIVTADNIFVIWAVRSNRALRKATYLFIVSLCIADLTVGIAALPLRALEAISFQYTRSILWCRISLCLSLLSLSASILNLLLVTIDRYLAVHSPLLYKSKVTSKRAILVILITWIFCIAFSFFPMLGFGTSTAKTRNREAQEFCSYAKTMDAKYLIVFPAFVILVPTVLMSCMYIRIYSTARGHEKVVRRSIRSLQAAKLQSAQFLKESKASKTVGVVVGMFYVCWIPFMVAMFLSVLNKPLATQRLILVVSILVYSNSAINPILYGCLNREFRITYKRLMRGLCTPCMGNEFPNEFASPRGRAQTFMNTRSTCSTMTEVGRKRAMTI